MLLIQRTHGIHKQVNVCFERYVCDGLKSNKTQHEERREEEAHDCIQFLFLVVHGFYVYVCACNMGSCINTSQWENKKRFQATNNEQAWEEISSYLFLRCENGSLWETTANADPVYYHQYAILKPPSYL